MGAPQPSDGVAAVAESVPLSPPELTITAATLGLAEPEALALALPMPSETLQTASIGALALFDTADAGPSADLAAPEPYRAPVVEPAQSSSIVEATAVMAGWTVDLPFSTNPAAPTEVFGTRLGAPFWMRRGQNIATVNGTQVASLEDIRQVIRTSGAPNRNGTWSVDFGIQAPGSSEISEFPGAVPAIRQIALLNGIRFKTVSVGNGWETEVHESPFSGDIELQTGDVLVGFIPTGEKLEEATSLVEILERELAAGRTNFDFAVRRDGGLWVVTLTTLSISARINPDPDATFTPCRA